MCKLICVLGAFEIRLALDKVYFPQLFLPESGISIKVCNEVSVLLSLCHLFCPSNQEFQSPRKDQELQ